MSKVRESILKTVAYFDIFHYPLTAGEIVFFMDTPAYSYSVLHELHFLTGQKYLYKLGEYYSLHNDESLVVKRIKETGAAAKQLKRAGKIAVLLSWFPYVKGVAVSGSLSKNVTHEKGDIDFFVIAAANRLWVAKLFLLIFYKCAAAFGFGKWLCLNYMIDETALKIQEKNIFTAIEIATLLPYRGNKTFELFFKTNEWVYGFLPNHSVRIDNASEYKPVLIKRITEWLFNGKRGDKADNSIMKFFEKRWKKLRAKEMYTATGYLIGSMVVDKHFCKPFPEHFQQKILNMYQEKIDFISCMEQTKKSEFPKAIVQD